MTQTCLGANCPFCSGEACRACPQTSTAGSKCAHDRVERHVAAPVLSDLAISRTGTPTTPLAKSLLGGRIEVDLSDADALAEFLELVARIARLRKKITIIIE